MQVDNIPWGISQKRRTAAVRRQYNLTMYLVLMTGVWYFKAGYRRLFLNKEELYDEGYGSCVSSSIYY
jgi:hypothetical protein